MQWFRKVLVILFLLLTSSPVMAFNELFSDELSEALDRAREEYKEYVSYLKSGDLFYQRLTQIGLDTRSRIQFCCSQYANEYLPFSGVVKSQACFRSLELMYPGSSFAPAAGGYVRINNYIVYLTAAPKCDFTKIVYEGDYTIQAAVLSNDPVLKEIVYNVYVRIGNREAVFTLQKNGIKEIQNISTIYDIQRKFLTAGAQVTENQLLFDLVKYYQFLKSQKKGLSSFDFIQSMLLDLRAQSDFVRFAMQQGEKK